MSGFTNEGTRRFANNAALGKGIRVIVSAGYLAAAGVSDVATGVMEFRSLATDESATVRLRTAEGTQLMVASGAITSGNPVYAAASGKVASSGTVYCGTALEAATADGDIIEVLPGPNTDLSAATAGTTAAAFEVDTDGAYPTIELAAQTAGTGDFKATIKPPATLTAARVWTLVGDATDTIVGATASQTLSNKVYTGTSLAVTAGITSSGATGAGIGYATGAGGAVTQASSRTTGVTLNTLAGAITTDSTSLAAGAEAEFTVTNSTVAATDVVVVCLKTESTTGTSIAYVSTVASGSFKITLSNLHASTADTSASVINFAVIKAVAA